MTRILNIAIVVMIAAGTALPASACQIMKPHDAAQANFVFVGEATDIDVTYYKNRKWWEKRNASSATVTFKIKKVIKGDYSGDRVDATFGFNWFGDPPTSLRELRKGDQHLSLVGTRLIDADAGTAFVIGGICSSTYYMSKPKPDQDKNGWAEKNWQGLVEAQ